MRDFMKLTALAGAVAFVVWGVPACGGDDDDDGGKKTGGGTGGGVIGGAGGTDAATGGTGGGTGGTGGGTGGTGGGTGGSTSITCGTLTCPGYNIAGFLDIPACCAGSASDKCGADVPELVAGFIGVPAGCYETEQAGPEDPGCPPLAVDLPIGDGGSISFPGCCNAASSTCGVVLDTSQFGGPNFGCANLPTEGGTPQACPTDGGTGGSAGGPGDAGTDAPADAPASG